MPSHEYRVTVDGELSDQAGRAFEGVTLRRVNGRTVLVGTIDQAQLHALLRRVNDLGLTLISAAVIEPEL